MDNRIIERISRIAHEINKTYCESLGDTTQVSWDEAPDWQKESAFLGVIHLLENPSATPENSHESWYNHKLEQGWTYGPIKDVDKKEHPCMLPYGDLPDSQKLKDKLFGTVVRAHGPHG
jgi:hypothetical protein